MEEILEKTLLFDFYGELMTDHQRAFYEDVVFNDMSLSEAAEVYGITRQGAHDLLRRCDRMLEGYEARLHLVSRFSNLRRITREMGALLDSGDTGSGTFEALKGKYSELLAEI